MIHGKLYTSLYTFCFGIQRFIVVKYPKINKNNWMRQTRYVSKCRFKSCHKNSAFRHLWHFSRNPAKRILKTKDIFSRLYDPHLSSRFVKQYHMRAAVFEEFVGIGVKLYFAMKYNKTPLQAFVAFNQWSRKRLRRGRG